MSNVIEKKVSETLTTWGVAYSARYMGEQLKDWGGKPDTVDAFRVCFSRGPVSYETDYFMGLGHRKTMPGTYGKGKKPVLPCAAAVLHSLVLDASAADQSFSDWCDDFGYSSDSFKAFNTYTACCEAGKQLRRLFNREQMETLGELLQDY